MRILSVLFILLLIIGSGCSSENTTNENNDSAVTADLTEDFIVHNRSITVYDEGYTGIELDAMENDGIAWSKDLTFQEGRIEFDVRGENVRGKSFVGIAFNGKDNETYEAVYFRPFNFLADNQDNRNHMVQYIHHPEFSWRKLREERTMEFEAEIQNPPNPDGWFHAAVEVTSDSVHVYVENRPEPVLSVERLANYEANKLGFWVGFGSSGRFANLLVAPEE